MSKKRTHGEQQANRKKFKVSSGFIDPGTAGVYATCARRHERQAIQELRLLFEEKIDELYGEQLKDDDEEDSGSADMPIEDQINQELAGIKAEESDNKKEKKVLQSIELDCECVIFFKMRKPVIPEELVAHIMQESVDPSSKIKRTRYIQKLTPITNSCNATMEQFIKLLQVVLKAHFHEGDNATQSYRFAVEVSRRNFNTMERMDIINQVVKQVTKDGEYKHTVDLKNYDRLVIVDCFKNNIGVCVVNSDYRTKYRKYNIQQIFESKFNTKDTDEN